jgi:molecular chaperone DnaJ
MTKAALGCKENIQTLDGELELNIKPGTQSNDVIPIKGKGMTRLRGGGRGDLFVHVNVEIPTKLSKPEEELLREFSKMRGEETRAGSLRKNSEDGLFSKFRDAFRS